MPPSRKKSLSTTVHESGDKPIQIRGARVHNLRSVDVDIPRKKLVVVTGVSGSGKSSLTMDTVFAEGQRKYAESLSAYARQFLNRMNKPEVDDIKGLCPAIAIEQKVITRTPRSTVGSSTEIYDYLRLLYARIGRTISPVSGKEVTKQDVADVVDFLKKLPGGEKIFLLTEIKLTRARSLAEELNILIQKGFARFGVQPNDKKQPFTVYNLDSFLELSAAEQKKQAASATLYLLVDRLVTGNWEEDDLHRVADSVGTAFTEGEGRMYVRIGEQRWESFHNRLEADGLIFEDPVPYLFSFNHPFGACPTCEGYSQVLGIDSEKVIPDTRLSVYDGAVAPWRGEKLDWWRQQFIKRAKSVDFPIHRPIADLTDKQLKTLWSGIDGIGIDDFFADVESQLYKVQFRVLLSRYRGRTLCPDCQGTRLRKEAGYIRIGGYSIGEVCAWPVDRLADWMRSLSTSLRGAENVIAKRLLIELNNRLGTLQKVGLGYLTLDRLANSLSGGESQRIQLTRNLGSNLTRSLYILDEPSIGLHPRDTDNLIRVLEELRALGNTVVVVEHDEQMMRRADHIIDMGPLAAHLGGQVIAQGNAESIMQQPQSLTGKYLGGALRIRQKTVPRTWNRSIQVLGASQHNLKNIDVEIPLGVLTVICGVSGSGKTTLVKKILHPALLKELGEATEKPGLHRQLKGDLQSIQQVELVDQNPIGKSSRSNPVTYIKAYDTIRDLYAEQPASVRQGFTARHFSFNVDGGRCDTCQGEGEQIVEMQFLADVHLVCESCGGKRFKLEVLDVTYKEKNIYEVLDMSVDEALDFFSTEKPILKAIQPLASVGLGYIKLGQSANTLSGGEAQRVKLASFLAKSRGQQQGLFIFDEPTTGLHFHDIEKLLGAFEALIEQGHTVLVIEHNTDVIRSADWVIELGPEAGDAGGDLVFAGKPSELKRSRRSRTAPFL
ncbi:MAG: excinuclease ABC subunit A [Bacteroidetes bacterium]|nr:excinuclease ABC subunit A [Bacteroidota bacterium]